MPGGGLRAESQIRALFKEVKKGLLMVKGKTGEVVNEFFLPNGESNSESKERMYFLFGGTPGRSPKVARTD